MRILVAVVVALSLAGCATNFSSLENQDRKGTSNLIIGDLDTVKISIRQAIHKEYPGDELNESSEGVFGWSHMPFMDRTSFQLQLFGATGLDENKRQIHGFYYTVETHGTQAAVDARYVQPLRRAIDDALQSNGLQTIAVSLLSRGTLSEEGKALTDAANACFTDLQNDPTLAVLKSKINFDDTMPPSFAMLTDTSKPTADERQAILRWARLREKCLPLEHTAVKGMGMPAQLGVAMDSLVSNQQALIAQLYMGNLSYAEFASKMQALENGYREQSGRAMTEIKRAADEERDRQRQIDATRKAAPIIVQPAPVRGPSTCTYGGGVMVCN